MTTAMARTDPVVATATAAPIGTHSIRTARSRVAKVFKRLRRKNPSDAQKRLSRFGAESLDCLGLENKSEISGITDIEYGDDLTCDGGKSTRKQDIEESTNLQASKSLQRFPHSFVPPFPTKISNSTDPSFSQSLETWFDSLYGLATSKEMDSFLQSSTRLAASATHKSLETVRNAGEMAVYTALLPVTLPLHVTASATGLVFNTGSSALHYLCDNVVPIVINHSIKVPMLSKTADSENSSRLQDGSESRTNTSMSQSTKVKKSSRNQLKNGQLSYNHDDFLDRLLLDSHLISRIDTTRERTTNHDIGIDNVSQAVYSVDTDSLTLKLNTSATNGSDYSKFLLRVDDVNVNFMEDPDSDSEVRVFCVDLDEDFSNDILTSNALTQLAQRGVDIALSNDFVLNMLPEQPTKQSVADRTICVDWKPLGQTKNDYNRLIKLSKNEYYDELCGRVCIWTGKYLGEKYHGSENPFFMAQGVVNGSPIEILNLLWDSKRTNEYNKHCVNREDVFSVVEDEEVINRAKVIRSETKVPFTSMTIGLSALMCAKLLGNRPEDGFIIFSRSLSRGPTGYHSSKTEGLCRTSKNEVILGINIMRPVTGRSDLSNLISISQVDASILPPFLKSRVGVMAVEDFFKNVRIALQSSNDN